MENIKKCVEKVQSAEKAKTDAMEELAAELTSLIDKLYEKGITIYTDPDCEIAVVGVLSTGGGKVYLGTEWSSDLE